MHQAQTVNKKESMRSRLLLLTLSDLLAFIGINLLLFQVALQQMFPMASYLDEAACILLTIIALLHKSVALPRQLRLSFIFLFCFFLASMLSSLLSDVDTRLTALLTDAFTCTKFAFALWASYRLFMHSERLFALLQAEAKLLLSVMFILAIVNLTLDVGVGATGDFGIPRAFRFIFYHPAAVVWFSVALVSTLLFDINLNRVYLIMGLVVT